MCGCNITRNLGCFDSCESIATGITATESGTWTIRVCFNGVWLQKELEFQTGDEIIIPNDYPEQLLLRMQLFTPAGKHYMFNTYGFTNKIVIKS
jgi:hypothetical protein